MNCRSEATQEQTKWNRHLMVIDKERTGAAGPLQPRPIQVNAACTRKKTQQPASLRQVERKTTHLQHCKGSKYRAPHIASANPHRKIKTNRTSQIPVHRTTVESHQMEKQMKQATHCNTNGSLAISSENKEWNNHFIAN